MASKADRGSASQAAQLGDHVTHAMEAVARDLEWAIAGPPLSGQLPPLFAHWARAGKSVDVDEEIASHRRSPIGRYFERLVSCWLAAQEGVCKLESNLPVRRGTATLGEVDLLFEVGGKAYHWELALKFYLGTGDRREARQWFGPQGRDRLDLKLDKLGSQLQLLDTPEGKWLLQERGIESAESHGLIKGYLFHPFDSWKGQQRPVPPEVNAEHAHGWWIHQSEVEQIVERSSHWRVLAKPEWLAAAMAGQSMPSAKLRPWLAQHFSTDTRPPMLAAVDEQGREMERGFVVVDDWVPSPR